MQTRSQATQDGTTMAGQAAPTGQKTPSPSNAGESTPSASPSSSPSQPASKPVSIPVKTRTPTQLSSEGSGVPALAQRSFWNTDNAADKKDTGEPRTKKVKTAAPITSLPPAPTTPKGPTQDHMNIPYSFQLPAGHTPSTPINAHGSQGTETETPSLYSEGLNDPEVSPEQFDEWSRDLSSLFSNNSDGFSGSGSPISPSPNKTKTTPMKRVREDRPLQSLKQEPKESHGQITNSKGASTSSTETKTKRKGRGVAATSAIETALQDDGAILLQGTDRCWTCCQMNRQCVVRPNNIKCASCSLECSLRPGPESVRCAAIVQGALDGMEAAGVVLQSTTASLGDRLSAEKQLKTHKKRLAWLARRWGGVNDAEGSKWRPEEA